jgi:uncharacterized protein (TIGR03435 family)
MIESVARHLSVPRFLISLTLVLIASVSLGSLAQQTSAASPPKPMAADADPSFEVATIKPDNSGMRGLQALNLQGRNLRTVNSSLVDLISFAYEVQAKQIQGGPDWIDNDRYDIIGVPDQAGEPNMQQIRIMLRKLLADRFGLIFHHDKRELSAFVLTVAKSGPRLASTQFNGPSPSLGLIPKSEGLALAVRNGTMTDFTGYLQAFVLDRPVVDHTGLTGRYDFAFTFTPDDSQFNGDPPRLPTKTDSTEPAPSFFQAIQQVGLKLDAQKTAVDVIAIDHVEKPSAN